MAEAKSAQTIGKKEQRYLQQVRMREMEYANHVYRVFVEMDTTREDLANPAYWAHVAPYFAQYDKVVATPDDGSWYAEFLVVSCASNWAKLREIIFIDLDPKDAEKPLMGIPQGYEVKWKGPHLKWCALRTSDSASLKTGFGTSAEAVNWLIGHVKAAA